MYGLSGGLVLYKLSFCLIFSISMYLAPFYITLHLLHICKATYENICKVLCIPFFCHCITRPMASQAQVHPLG